MPSPPPPGLTVKIKLKAISKVIFLCFQFSVVCVGQFDLLESLNLCSNISFEGQLKPWITYIISLWEHLTKLLPSIHDLWGLIVEQGYPVTKKLREKGVRDD